MTEPPKTPNVVRMGTWAKQRSRDRQFNQLDVINQMVRMVSELQELHETVDQLKKNQMILTLSLNELLARVEQE